MADELPEPLVDISVDLSGARGFVIDVNRLLASELVALGTPEEKWFAFMLWCRAWQQTPPGSLPADERALAAFSGAGTKWKKVKDIALRGFIMCNDGRLYHPVLCGHVLQAWTSRKAYRADQERLRKWREKQKEDGSETRFSGHFEIRGGNGRETPIETGKEGEGEGEGRKERKKESERVSRAQAPTNARARKTKISPNWLPEPADMEFARESGITDVIGEISKFINYSAAHEVMTSNWSAMFRRWCDTEPHMRKATK